MSSEGRLQLARVVHTCVAAPSQWDAWTTDGRRLLLRYRHGRGRVEAWDGPNSGDRLAYCYWDDRGGSHITLEDFMSKAGLELAEGAEIIDATGDPDSPGARASHADPARPRPDSGPVPLLQGTFALYQTPEGAVVLAYRAKGSSEDKKLMIPPFILQMAGQASGLSPEVILSRLQSGDIDD